MKLKDSPRPYDRSDTQLEMQVAWLLRDVESAKLNILGEGLLEFGLFVGQPRLLHLIEKYPASTQNQIAKMMRVSPSSISMSIKRLEKQELVERRTPDNDQRRNELFLTAAGHEVLEKSHSSLVEIHEYLLEGFDDDEKRILRDLLLRIMQNLEQHPLYSRSVKQIHHPDKKKRGEEDT